VPAALLQTAVNTALHARQLAASPSAVVLHGAAQMGGTVPVAVRTAQGALCHLHAALRRIHAAPHHAIRHVPKASGIHAGLAFGREDDKEEGEDEGHGHAPRGTGSGHRCAHVCEPVTAGTRRRQAEITCIGDRHWHDLSDCSWQRAHTRRMLCAKEGIWNV
jgi:hypothetical protein